MAQVDLAKIEKIIKDRNTIHDKVFATYSSFSIRGKKFVQIDTYGKSDREIPGKISQSFQIDEECAKFLVDLLKREFDI